MKEPRDMTAAEINRELDALDKKRQRLNDEFIAAGRGHETASETAKKTDPLAERWKALVSRTADLRNEISLRYGPGAPSRLPRGFGTRRDPRSKRRVLEILAENYTRCLDSDEDRHAVANALTRHSKDPKTMSKPLPPLSKWNTYAVNQNGKRSYDIHTDLGQFSISPGVAERGRHLGYQATFADTKGHATRRGMARGLHTWLDAEGWGHGFPNHYFRSPQAAHSALQKWASHLTSLLHRARDPKSSKFERCVKAVKKGKRAVNPWAVCHASVGGKGRHKRDPGKLYDLAAEREKRMPKSTLPSQAEYEHREALEFRRQLQQAEKGTLAERKEAASEWHDAIKNRPHIVAERIDWLLDGNYGYGSMMAAKRVLASPRMNIGAWMSTTIAALEWMCPGRMAQAEWKKLSSAEQARLKEAILHVLKNHAAEK